MPSMSNFYAYLAPVMGSDEDVRHHSVELPNKIEKFVIECAHVGLRRGQHFTIKPLQTDEITQAHPSYPTRVCLCEIQFRNRKLFEVFRSSGLADETDEPI